MPARGNTAAREPADGLPEEARQLIAWRFVFDWRIFFFLLWRETRRGGSTLSRSRRGGAEEFLASVDTA
jgi:hypothetical protein